MYISLYSIKIVTENLMYTIYEENFFVVPTREFIPQNK